jgi:hypothetical protein
VISPNELLAAADQGDPSQWWARLNLAMSAELWRFGDSLPAWAVADLETADAYWRGDNSRRDDMLAARLAAWNFLDTKNGSSVTIVDNEDRLIRALICVLFADDSDDPGMGAEFFADMINGVVP